MLVATAGCLTTSDSAGTPTAVELSSSETGCNRGLSFYGLNTDTLWKPDTIHVSYNVPPNASFFLVAYVDGNVMGSRHEQNPADGLVTVDGAGIDLNESLSGVHTVQVVKYNDTNGNGVFDRGVDRHCPERLHAGSERIDFDRFESE